MRRGRSSRRSDPSGGSTWLRASAPRRYQVVACLVGVVPLRHYVICASSALVSFVPLRHWCHSCFVDASSALVSFMPLRNCCHLCPFGIGVIAGGRADQGVGRFEPIVAPSRVGHCTGACTERARVRDRACMRARVRVRVCARAATSSRSLRSWENLTAERVESRRRSCPSASPS